MKLFITEAGYNLRRRGMSFCLFAVTLTTIMFFAALADGAESSYNCDIAKGFDFSENGNPKRR